MARTAKPKPLHLPSVLTPGQRKVLKSWLQGSAAGKELLHELVQEQRAKVLIVLDLGGWVDVYANDDADVVVTKKPRVIYKGPRLEEHERIAAEVVSLDMPKRFKKLFMPGHRKATEYWELTDLQKLLRQAQEDC